MANKKLELLEKRQQLIAEARHMAAEGAADAETNAKVEAILNEASEIGKRIAQLDRVDASEASAEPVRGILADSERGSTAAQRLEAQALTTYQQGGYPAVRQSEALSAALDALQLRALGDHLRFGAGALTLEQRAALNITDATRGGQFVAPPVFLTRLFQAMDDVTFLTTLCRAAGNLFDVTEAQAIEGISLDTDLDDFEFTTELATGSEDTSLALGDRRLRGYPMAKRVKYSKLFDTSSTFDVVALVLKRLSYKVGITLEKAGLTGNGVNGPLGLFVASSKGIPTSRDFTCAGSTELTFDDLIGARFAVKAQYRRDSQCGWLLSRTAIGKVALLRDETGGAATGQYLWQPSNQVGEPDMLSGRPVYESEFVPSTFTAGNYVGMFGAIGQAYAMATAVNPTIQRLLELYAESNQNGIIYRTTADGQPVLAEAVVRIKMKP
jgi:HK97 family phage major capsid protein